MPTLRRDNQRRTQRQGWPRIASQDHRGTTGQDAGCEGRCQGQGETLMRHFTPHHIAPSSPHPSDHFGQNAFQPTQYITNMLTYKSLSYLRIDHSGHAKSAVSKTSLTNPTSFLRFGQNGSRFDHYAFDLVSRCISDSLIRLTIMVSMLHLYEYVGIVFSVNYTV